jgi:hypothetical protein
MSPTTRMGPIGRITRLVAAAGLLYLALFTGTSWALSWYEALLGLLVFPGAMLALALAARRRPDDPLNFTRSAGTALNCAVVIGLVSNSYTGPAAELFYGATLLVAAWRGQLGCEATVISNWLLRRHDQVGCPVFSPIDSIEARRTAENRKVASRTGRTSVIHANPPNRADTGNLAS